MYILLSQLVMKLLLNNLWGLNKTQLVFFQHNNFVKRAFIFKNIQIKASSSIVVSGFHLPWLNFRPFAPHILLKSD